MLDAARTCHRVVDYRMSELGIVTINIVQLLHFKEKRN